VFRPEAASTADFPGPPVTWDEKRSLHEDWNSAFSQQAQKQAVCACCGSLTLQRSMHLLKDRDMPNRHHLKVPADFLPLLRRNHPREWTEMFTYGSRYLDGLLLEQAGLNTDESGDITIWICSQCFDYLAGRIGGVRAKLGACPPAALANGTWVGPVPPQLQALTPVEEAALSLNRASTKSFFFYKQAKDVPDRDPAARQRGHRGHFVCWPQYTGRTIEAITSVPLRALELGENWHISFVGPPPYLEQDLAQTFQVRPAVLLEAYNWLKTRNELYQFITWDQEAAASFDGSIPSAIERTFNVDEKRDAVGREGYAHGQTQIDTEIDVDDVDELESRVPAI
jgi:hypothetical protein